MGIVSRSLVGSGGLFSTGAASSQQLYSQQLVESIDPSVAGGSATPVTLQPQVVKVWVPATVTLATLTVFVSTAGVTLTAGSNRVGVYTVAGDTATLAAQSADIAAWATGEKAVALSGSVAVAGGSNVFCYLACLASATGTVPAFARGGGGLTAGNAMANIGLTAAAGWRSGALAAVVAGNPLPNSFTISTGITPNASLYYIGGK